MIMGKSATGKDHIYQGIVDNEELALEKLVLYTTRPKREGEENGREYYFTSVEHLEELRKSNKIIEERVYDTVMGTWYYFTADEGQIRTEEEDYITIGTLESFVKMREYFGAEVVCPIYIEVDDDIRLMRSIQRESKQKEPNFKELCRRYLADEEDFSKKKLAEAGIKKKFDNNGELEKCISRVEKYIRSNK